MANVRLSDGSVRLLRWLDRTSGAAMLWVDVDARTDASTYAPQIKSLVAARLAEFELDPQRRRMMRITTSGRVRAMGEDR